MNILTPAHAVEWAAASEQYLYCDAVITEMNLDAGFARVALLEAVYMAYCDAHAIPYGG
jgi:hypothetical protein